MAVNNIEHQSDSDGQNGVLPHVLVQQLKGPILQLSQFAQSHDKDSFGDMEIITESIMRQLEYYDLSARPTDQMSLQLEPVCIGAVLQEAAHDLAPIASLHNYKLRLELNNSKAPVMTDARRLKAAICSLGYSLLDAGQEDAESNGELVLAAYRSHGKQAVGVYGPQLDLSSNKLARLNQLGGYARQQMSDLGGSGAGIAVAQALLRQMALHLRASRRSGLSGAATSLLPSKQLQLV